MAVSRTELFEQLRELYSPLDRRIAWEDLAHKLKEDIGIPNDSKRLSDWRNGKGMSFEAAVLLLERAGYLAEAPSRAAADAAAVERAFLRIQEDLRELGAALQLESSPQGPRLADEAV